ncbi:hypothetical protein AKJ16_DCAP21704 [Drosera capensis]
MGRRGEEDCVWFGVDGCDRGFGLTEWIIVVVVVVGFLDVACEVADIKRMNSLLTDRQMYALKTLQIPLPGRHPPSPCLSNGSHMSERTPPRRRSEILESLHSLRVNPGRKVSPAMSSLQGYYGLNLIQYRRP